MESQKSQPPCSVGLTTDTKTQVPSFKCRNHSFYGGRSLQVGPIPSEHPSSNSAEGKVWGCHNGSAERAFTYMLMRGLNGKLVETGGFS